MKTARVPEAQPNAPAKVEFQVQFSGGPKGKARSTLKDIPTPESVEKTSFSRVPKITRLLVLGHHFESLVRQGVVKDYAVIARLTGLSRARITQIVNLTLLAPKIQEGLLNLPLTCAWKHPPPERALRIVVANPEWKKQQRAIHHAICPPTSSSTGFSHDASTTF